MYLQTDCGCSHNSLAAYSPRHRRRVALMGARQIARARRGRLLPGGRWVDLSGLGATAPTSAPSPATAYAANSQAALAQFAPDEKSGAGYFTAMLEQAIAARTLPLPSMQNASTDCTGYTATSNVTQKVGTAVAGGSSIASGIMAASPAAGPFAPVVAAIGAVTGLVTGLIGAHHAAAVQEQTAAICSAVPQMQAQYAAIDQQLASGQMTPSQAQAAYANLKSQFSSAMKSGTSYKTGDALWSFDMCNQAVIAARLLDLQAGVLTGGGQAPWTLPGAAAALTELGGVTGLPMWALLALGAAAVFLM